MKKFPPFCYIVFILILLSTLSACENGQQSNTETGAIRFAIKLDETGQRMTALERSAVDCDILGIANVNVAVLTDPGAQSLVEGSWPCSAHNGELTKITPGNGFIVEVRGLDTDNTVKYFGRAQNITVNAGATTPVEVTLEAVTPTIAVTLVKDIYAGERGSHPHQLKPLGNKLFFVARQPDTDFELFVSDGTAAGTQRVKDINPLPPSAPYTGAIPEPENLTELNDLLYFFADDGVNGPSLWQTDGTNENTIMVDGFAGKGIANPSHLTAVNDKLFFAAESSEFGRELWTSDGTAAGTRMVHDIFSGAQSSTPHEFVALGNWLYFVANDDTHGIEIWRSNGTVTELVQDIHTGAVKDDPGKTKDSYASELTLVNGRIFCRAVGHSTGDEIWMITGDDTSSRVDLVADLNLYGDKSSRSRDFTAINNTYLAFAATQVGADETESQTGNELWLFDWQSDTAPVRYTDINLGVGGSNPSNVVSMNGTLYFTANNSLDGGHLWAVPMGAVGVPVCLTLGMVDPAPQNLTIFEGRLYFSAFEDSTGRELWYTDGTTTERVNDLCPGTCSSSPTDLTVVGNRLYFSAYATENGKEMYQLNLEYIVSQTADN